MSQRQNIPVSTPPITGVLGKLAALDKLPDGDRMERKADGSVIYYTKIDAGSKSTGASGSEIRVDSRQDADILAKGGTLWYTKFLVTAKVPK